MSNIIIIGEPTDPQAHKVAEELKHRYANVHFMSLASFAERDRTSWNPESERGCLTLDGCTLPFEKIVAVYWQNANPLNAYISRESMSALSPFFHYRACRWINGIDAIRYHQNKPRQLAHAKQLGATIPATFIGNCETTAEQFIFENQSCIVKPVHGGALTRSVSACDTDAEQIAALLRDGPVTLQQRIEGEHIRTFVLGHHVLSATIHSEYLDYRKDTRAGVSEYLLNRSNAELARRICRGFGMAWCAIDWKLMDNRLYFLEANPCPHFAQFEKKTCYPIASCLANMLMDVNTLC